MNPQSNRRPHITIRSILQSAGAIIASLAAAFLLVVAVEGGSAIVHPFPPGFDGSGEQMLAHVANYPAWVLALAVIAWGITMFVSTWLATRLGTDRHPAHGIGVGLFLLAAVAFNMYLLPYPVWFEAANIILFPILGFYGARMGRDRKRLDQSSVALS
jgi:hypothetical protein